MSEIVYIVIAAIVGIVAIVAIVFGRNFRFSKFRDLEISADDSHKKTDK